MRWPWKLHSKANCPVVLYLPDEFKSYNRIWFSYRDHSAWGIKEEGARFAYLIPHSFALQPIPPLPWYFQYFCAASKDLLLQGCPRCYFFSAILSFYRSFTPALSSLPFHGNLVHVPYFSPDPLNLCPIKCSVQISSLGHDKYSAVQPLWICTLLIYPKWKTLLGLAATVSSMKTYLSCKLQAAQFLHFQ